MAALLVFFSFIGQYILILSANALHMATLPRSRAPPRFVVTEYGAVGDGRTLNTKAIQSAIDAAEAAGHGLVEIPHGTYRSGSIFLKQGVELWLAEGAVLLGSTDIADYPKRSTRIEGHFEPWPMALVNAQALEGVRIGGRGTINGNGVPFWKAFWQRRQENAKCTNLEVPRPRLMFIDTCRDVRIEGLALLDSGFWNLHIYRSREVVVEGVSITVPSAVNGLRAPSTDGIDIDSSQNVAVRHSFISVHDDCIALKGSKGPLADKDETSPPVENITVEHCEVGTGNGLITCGSEATLVHHVMVRNCVIPHSQTMITMKLRPDTPQHYEDITMDGITFSGRGGGGQIFNVKPWLQFFDLHGQPMPKRTVNNITIRNVHGKLGSLGDLLGNPGDILRYIALENVDIELASRKFKSLGPVQNFTVRNMTVNGRAFKISQVRSGRQRRLLAPQAETEGVRHYGNKTRMLRRLKDKMRRLKRTY